MDNVTIRGKLAGSEIAGTLRPPPTREELFNDFADTVRQEFERWSPANGITPFENDSPVWEAWERSYASAVLRSCFGGMIDLTPEWSSQEDSGELKIVLTPSVFSDDFSEDWAEGEVNLSDLAILHASRLTTVFGGAERETAANLAEIERALTRSLERIRDHRLSLTEGAV